MKEWKKKICHEIATQNEAEAGALISDDVDFRQKKKKRNIANVKGRPCIMTTWSIHQKDIMILCVHTPNRASKYLKHKLIEQKEKKKKYIYIYIHIQLQLKNLKLLSQ